MIWAGHTEAAPGEPRQRELIRQWTATQPSAALVNDLARLQHKAHWDTPGSVISASNDLCNMPNANQVSMYGCMAVPQSDSPLLHWPQRHHHRDAGMHDKDTLCKLT